MKRRDIVLIGLIIIVGLTINFVRSKRSFFRELLPGEPKRIADSRDLQAFAEEALNFSDIRIVNIHNAAGDITIQENSHNTTSIRPTLRIAAEQERDRHRIKNSTTVDAKVNGSQVDIYIKYTGRFPLRKLRVNMDILLAAGSRLTISNRYGDVTATDLSSSLQIKNTYGDINLSNLTADTTLSVYRAKRVQLTNLEDVEMRCRHADITIDGIRRNLHIQYASLCKIDARNCQNVFLQGAHNRMELSNIPGNITIKNSHQPIYLNQCSGNIQITGRNSRIKIRDSSARSISVQNSYQSIDASGISADTLDFVIAHGDLNVEFTSVNDSIQVKGSSSDVILRYAEGLNPSLNVRNYNGRIINKTTAALPVRKERYTLILKSDHGRPNIEINNRYGQVILKNF